MTMSRDNLAGAFVRDDCQLRLAGAGGNLVAVTAAGDVLEKNWNVLRAWDNWQELPAEQRQRGVVNVPAVDESDAPLTGQGGRLLRLPAPPPEALVVKLHLRALSRGEEGLRHMREEDIPADHHMKRKQNYYDANPDYLWLKKDEWLTLVPKEPQPGQTFVIEDVVSQRIIRFHLNPTLVFGETNGLRKEDVRDSRLQLEVTDVSPQSIAMRLTGFAKVGSDFATADANAKAGKTSPGYEPQILGYLTFDRRAGRFTRFDVVALGDTYGQLGGDLKYLYRPGRNPLGVAFHLVSPDGPIADRTVPPRGMRFPHNYYATDK